MTIRETASARLASGNDLARDRTALAFDRVVLKSAVDQVDAGR